MKKFKPVSVKTIVLGRTGKTVVHTPLTVSSNAAGSQPNEGTSSLSEAVDDHVDVPVFTPDEAQHSAAHRRNYSSAVNWEKVRDKLFSTAVGEEPLPEKCVCVACKQRESTVRCRYCGPRQFFCWTCAHHLHAERNQFHVLEQWKDNRFIPLFPNHGAIESGHSCSTRILKLFKLIDAFGNQHLKEVSVCDCESHAVTLVRCQFWPGSPERPSVGFHFKLMDLAEKLFLHSQVSVKEFSELILEMTPPLQPNFIPSLYAILNSGCFEEYRYFKYRLKYLNSYVPELYSGAECPLCPKENGVLIESIDACFGLARKKAKGGNAIASRHGDLLFSDQDDVDNFVDNYPHSGQRSLYQDCNRFHAGEVLPALRSKGKNQLFDEKGVFGRVCRHDFPKSLLSIKHGERISYSVYELKKLRDTIAADSLKVVLMYDIACILSSHLKNSGQEELLSGVSLAIPIFHCYGHKASCQVQFSPRRTPNIGLTDGEGVERFWSYLRQFSTITKEMSVDKRVDVLTDASLHFGEHLFYRFVPTMIAKLKKASTLLYTVGEEIRKLIVALPEGCDLDTVRQWIDNEMSEIVPREKDLSLQWDETYVELLVAAFKLKSQISFAKEQEPLQVDMLERKMSRNEKTLAGMEKKHGIRERWQESDATFQNTQQRLTTKKRNNEVMRLHKMASERIFLLELKAKYADGQAIAIKLANQIDKVVNSMNQGLATLNGLRGDGDNTVTFEDIKDPDGELYCPLSFSNGTDNVPVEIKKKLVHLMSLEDRCKEEKTLVKEEMLRFFTFISEQINTISLYQDKESVDRGLASLLQQKIDVYKKNLQLLTCMCKESVIFPAFEEPEETYLQFSEVEIETPVDVDNLYDFSLFEDQEFHNIPIRGWNDEDFDE